MTVQAERRWGQHGETGSLEDQARFDPELRRRIAAGRRASRLDDRLMNIWEAGDCSSSELQQWKVFQ
jgi:hypothetical protein